MKIDRSDSEDKQVLSAQCGSPFSSEDNPPVREEKDVIAVVFLVKVDSVITMHRWLV
jgi:hypothetical protein